MLNNDTNNTPVILWGVSISPYVRKVMVALAEKNIAYEQKEILPSVLLRALGQEIPEAFNLASPLGKIPALQIGDFTLADSAVITAYLDQKYPSTQKLYPTNPEDYAKTLWFERYADTTLTEVAYKKIFLEAIVKPKVLNLEPNLKLIEEASKVELPPLLDYLNQQLQHSTWIAGEQFTIADIAITTQLLALKLTGFSFSHWQHLETYLTQAILRPSYKKIVTQ